MALRYTLVIRPGADNEKQSTHTTWQAAYKALRKHDEAGNCNDEVEVIEQDADGRRAYDRFGEIIWREERPER